MTRTKITFSYEEICDFSQPTVITVEVPERSIDEVCEYFQRFLTAAGYLFENNEKIRCVSTEAQKSPCPVTANDILTFSNDDYSYVYDFGDNSPVYFGTGMLGGMGNDTFYL